MTSRSGRREPVPGSTDSPRTTGGWYDLADLGCAGLSLGLAIASVRLFSDTDTVLVLVAVGLGSWALASTLRRTPLPGWLADIAHLLIGVVALLVVAAPAQRWGFLPTPGSVQTIVAAVRHDFTRFDQDVAPLAAGVGHLVVMSVLLWVLALFNSTSAMRLKAPVQGVIPHIVAFVGLGFVAREPGRTTASVAMFVAVGIYGVTQVAWRNAAINWVPGHPKVAVRSLAAGLGILTLTALVTTIAVPLLPGDAEPQVDLRRGGLGESGPRTVVSPFVEVGANLGPRSDELLFEVESETAQYWRLTALDTYDAEQNIWVLSNTYTPVDGELVDGAHETGSATMIVRGLGGIWVPAPDGAVTADAPFALNWDAAAGSLIKRSGDLSSADAVSIGTSGDPGVDIDVERLRSASPAAVHGDLVDPTGTPPVLGDLARDMARDLSPYEGLLALQNYFHDSFSYDESIDLSGEDDPLAAFLDLKRGFCQQFSTAFALGARSMGYPARVVVGFTPGDRQLGDPGEPSVFSVRGRHAHAWPEVRFEGVGWVPFEPTPGRGNPATSDITGITGAQAAPPISVPDEASDPSTVEPVTEPTTAPQADPATPDTGEQVTAGEPQPPADGGSALNRWPIALGVLVALAILIAAGLFAARRRSARQPLEEPHPVARQWILACDAVAHIGLIRAEHETPMEFARRCDARVDLPGMIDLAEVETVRLWSPFPTSDSDVAAARVAVEAINRRLEDLDDAVLSAVAVEG